MTKPATSFSFHHPIILSQPISELFSDGKESKCFKYKMNKDHKADFHWTTKQTDKVILVAREYSSGILESNYKLPIPNYYIQGSKGIRQWLLN